MEDGAAAVGSQGVGFGLGLEEYMGGGGQKKVDEEEGGDVEAA